MCILDVVYDWSIVDFFYNSVVKASVRDSITFELNLIIVWRWQRLCHKLHPSVTGTLQSTSLKGGKGF